MKPSHRFLSSVLLLASLTSAQSSDVTDCGLNCIADVSGTSCTQAQWSCLCRDQGYLQRLNQCTSRSCNHQDYESTISAVAEICAVFNETLTVAPYATATTGTENPLVSTVAIPSVSTSIPIGNLSSTIETTTDTNLPSTPTITTSTAGTESTTPTDSPTAASSSMAAPTTTNIAQRVDTKQVLYQGVAIALLGLAVYFKPLATCAPTNFFLSHLNLRYQRSSSPSFTTAPYPFKTQPLSPRALEKQPVHEQQTLQRQATVRSVTAVPQVPFPSGPVISRPQPRTRRSILQYFLARQQNKETPDTSPRTASSSVINPINYVPRPTPVYLPQQQTTEGPDRTSLLSIPEQRRSRHNSPHTSTFTDSGVDGENGNRTSIGLPSHQRVSAQSFERRSSMPPPPPPEKDRPVSKKEGPEVPEKTFAPKYNPQDRDVEAQQPPGTAQSALGSSYGFNPQDQPTQPPRRVASSRSLSRVRSLGSMRSSVYGSKNVPQTDAGAPPPIPAQFANHPNYVQDDQDDQGSESEEVPWGPSHPCFPHPNPHVPLNSAEYLATRIIRIRRDWMVVGDLAPTYSNIYPEILDPLLSESEFRFLLQHVNSTLIEAFDPFSAWNWFDGLLGLATGWLWEDFRPGGVKGKLRELERWIEEWNHTVGARDGVKVIPLRRTAYMNLDIQIPDPQVRVIGEDEYDDERRIPGTEREESVLQIDRDTSRPGTERGYGGRNEKIG